MAFHLKSNFKIKNKHGAFYTGGKVQMSNDGTSLICQNNNTVEVIEVQTGHVLKTVGKEAEDAVTSFVLSPDDKMLIISGRSLLLRQYDWIENTLDRTWKAIHHAPITCMNFDATSTLLATGSADTTIKVWDVLQQYCTHNLRGHTGVISDIEFHPDISKLQLYSAGDDYKIRVWDLKTSVCVAVLESHYSRITALVFSPDNLTLYSGGRDKVITMWNIESYKKEKTIPIYESIEGMVLIPNNSDTSSKFSELGVETDDTYVLTAGSEGALKVWNVNTSSCVHTFEIFKSSKSGSEESVESSLTDVMYNKTLDKLTVVTYDHNIVMYNMTDLSLVKQFVGYQDDILDLKFLGHNDSHLAVATNSPLIKVYKIENWDCHILHGHTDTVMALDVSTDKQLLVSAAKDNNIYIWRLQSDSDKLKCIAHAPGHTNSVQSVAFSRVQSSFIVSGSQDLTMKMWPIPDESSDDKVSLLHAEMTEKVHDKEICSIVVAPNDKFIATGSQDKTAKLWRANDFSLLGVFRGHTRGIWCVKFSPVDQCLATASADGNIKIWSLSDYSCVKTFEGHDAQVLNLSFMSNGMQLVSSAADGLLKLWTIKSSECVQTYDEHDDKIWALACNQKEDTIVTGAEDSQIILWEDVTIQEQEEIRAKQEDLILKVQELENLVQQKKYLKAIGLAIKLDQPFRVLNVIKEILAENVAEDLEKTILKLENYQLDAILRYAGTWNTNAKHCHATQHVLSIILKSYSPTELFKLPNFRSSLEGLLPYTERHILRLRRLEQQSTFVDYTWQCMRLVAGDGLLTGEENDKMDFEEGHSATDTKHLEVSASSSNSSDESESEMPKKTAHRSVEKDSSSSYSENTPKKTKCKKRKEKHNSKLMLKEGYLHDKGDSAFSDQSDSESEITTGIKNKSIGSNKTSYKEVNNTSDTSSSDDQMDNNEGVDEKLNRKPSYNSDSDSSDQSVVADDISHTENVTVTLRKPYTTFKMYGGKNIGKSKNRTSSDKECITPKKKLKKKKEPQTAPVQRTKHSKLKTNKLKKGRKSIT